MEHYKDVTEIILAAGMPPIVTLLHFDTPWTFVANTNIGYDDGGYWNEEFVESYVSYSKTILSHFANCLPIWNHYQ